MKPKVNYRVLKDSVASQLNQTHNRTMLFKIKLNGVLPSIVKPSSDLFPLSFPIKML